MSAEKVRWGVLSTARIGTEKVIPAMQRGRLTQVVAIASRSLEKAQEAARRLGIPRAYGSYAELLEDPEVEAIYNPLPNHLHVPWTLKALQAGKHVLCEKPIGLSAQEAQALLDAARQFPRLKVMEAFMYRFHPQWQKTKELVEEGRIGVLRAVMTAFSYMNRNPEDIRNQVKIGGGALLDIGCYPVSLSRFLWGKEPLRAVAAVQRDPELGIDRLTSGMLDFGTGHSVFTVSTQLLRFQRVQVFGTEGRLELEIPFNAPPDCPCRMWHTFGSKTEELELPVADQYTIQGDLFSQAVREDAQVPTPLEDAVANMQAIDALFRSEQSQQWEAVL